MPRILGVILSFYLFVFLPYSCAQDIDFKKSNFPGREEEFKKAVKEFKAGKELFLQQRFDEALKHFLPADTFNNRNSELNYLVGKCYLYSPDKSKSVSYFEKALQLNKKVDDDIHFLMGSGYQLNYKWDKAVSEYNLFLKTLPENDAKMKKDVQKKIEECSNGKKLQNDSLIVEIENLGTSFNSRFTDYVSSVSADESVIMFTSRREETTGGVFDPFLNEYFEDIYFSYYRDGTWSTAQNIGPPVNSERMDAIAGLSFDGQRLFIYRDDEKGNGDIFESFLQGEKWSEPVKLPPPVNSEFHESSACLSYEGKTLFFVSDRPGSGAMGGRDIYKSKWNKQKKIWEKPVNLSSAINTPYDEEGVFIHPDGKTLYFSSKGHTTMGGFDIFKSTAKGATWSKPVNIGYPINTPDDDVFFALSASGKHAYYSSVKKGGYGKRDLYRITFINPPTEPYQPKLTLLKGIIRDAVIHIPLNVKIEITDNELNEIVAEFESNSNTGKYLVSLPSGKNYGIAVVAEGYLFHSENVNIPISYGYQELEKNIELNKLSIGEKIILRNIFFDFDQATLRIESNAELNRLVDIMNKEPSLTIEISGHTDSKGSDEYNQKLSEARAKSVVEYLISKGVKPERLTFKGYGETMPVATNETDEGSQQNRRTEFKIVSK